MALRSQIGSSLVAKANPASPLRKTEEMKINNPAIPGKAAPGSLGREFIEQPFLRPIPEGSARTVSVNPSAEAGSIASPTNQAPVETAGIAPGVGQPLSPNNLRSGANNQAMFQGGVSTPQPKTVASAPARAGVTAKSVSGAGVNKGAINPRGDILSTGASTEYQAPEFRTASTQLPLIKELGGGVVAGEEGKGTEGFPKSGATGTALQQVVGSLGKVLTNVGTKIGAGQLTPGGLGAKGQTFGGSAAVAKQGIGSAGNALRSIVQAIISPGGLKGAVINKTVSKLRSLFGKK
ncbi:hypothetical protein M0R04_12370 [Candidatus Dojkabacteria bacterium]|jgi:hypothetical protein|nr:hypothetical protein [Candidatus Dojkabacteria bacterium]